MDEQKNNSTNSQKNNEGEIEAGLGRLKSAGKLKFESEDPAKKDTLESKMPSRFPTSEETFKKIEIPTAKHFQREDSSANEALHGKPGFVEDTLSPHSGHHSGPLGEKGTSIAQDDSIFGGGMGISRKNLKRRMKTDPEIKKAARITKLGLSPAERAGLVKEVFSPRLGQYISEKDLSRGIKKLNRELRSTQPSSDEHREIRKEIKFFKKIRGI